MPRLSCCFMPLLLCVFCLLAAQAGAAEKEFAQFAASLPDGWDGDEQVGFISDNPEEYMLILGKKDAAGDKFLSQISIYLLPNRPGADARRAADILSEAQGEPSAPVEEGNFWVFEGEPRGNAVKGRGTTRVNTDPETMLVIISQDPESTGAEDVIRSLRGLTPKARALLGR